MSDDEFYCDSDGNEFFESDLMGVNQLYEAIMDVSAEDIKEIFRCGMVPPDFIDPDTILDLIATSFFRGRYDEPTLEAQRLAAIRVLLQYHCVDTTAVLIVAAQRGCSPAFAETLLKAGADVLDRRKGQSCLHHIARSDTARVLIAAGADVNSRDRSGQTPLHDALTTDWSVVDALLEAGADATAVDDDGWSVLHEAASCASTDRSNEVVMQALLDAGADPTVRTPDGESPLDCAVSSHCKPHVIKFLARAAAWYRRRHLLLIAHARGKVAAGAASGPSAVHDTAERPPSAA